jgi:hypothetical protein
MDQELSPAVKLMIESGIIPKNTVQQMARWRLLPEDSIELSGKDPVALENESPKVEKFVEDLRGALTEEYSTIRQTDLDRPGHFEEVLLVFENPRLLEQDTPVVVDKNGRMTYTQDVFIDRLGRLVLPAKAEYDDLKEVHFMSDNGEGPIIKEGVSREPRYEGTRKSALVVCLGDTNE